MSNIMVSAAFVERQIADLLNLCPELADDESLRADMVEGSTDLHGLLSRIAAAALDAKAMEAAIKSRIDELNARKDAAKRRQEAFRALAHRLMDSAAQKKAVLPEATLSIKAVPAGVVITDEEQIEARFIRTKTEVNKAAIKEALTAGETVAGACLGNSTTTLTIRGGA